MHFQIIILTLVLGFSRSGTYNHILNRTWQTQGSNVIGADDDTIRKDIGTAAPLLFNAPAIL